MVKTLLEKKKTDLALYFEFGKNGAFQKVICLVGFFF